MTEMRLGRIETVPTDDVKPYWRNPRRVTDEAVNMLRASIERFGYQQPIVVDSDYVIIVGHTRYAALRKMGEAEIDVMVADTLTPKQVKQYRVIDNKAGEYSSWDYEKLLEELAETDRELARSFFPEIDFGDDIIEMDLGGSEGEEEEQPNPDDRWGDVDNVVEFVCPSCFHGFSKEVTREQILTGRLSNG